MASSDSNSERIAFLLVENERLRTALRNIVETPRRDGILTCQRIASEALQGSEMAVEPAQKSLGDPVYYYRVKQYLHERYHGKCAYCGSPDDIQIDHLMPVSRGGSDEVSNLCLACKPCNQKKGTQTATEFGFHEFALTALGSSLPTFAERRRREQRKADTDRIVRAIKDQGNE